MTSEKQKRGYTLLAGIVVILLLAGQFWLQKEFDKSSGELERLQNELATQRKTVESRSALLEKYKFFEVLAIGPNQPERVYPENALELFAVVDKALKDNNLEHTNKNQSIDTAPGGTLQLQISFTGPYYGVLKALATLRESEYVMRVSDFKLSAEENSRVSGSMTILSTAKS